VFFGLATIGLYKFLLSYIPKKNPDIANDVIILTLTDSLSLILIIILGIFYQIPSPSLMAIYLIFGLSAGIFISQKIKEKNVKTLHLILITIFLAGITFLFFILKFEALALKQFKWGMLGFTVPFISLFIRKIKA
jgi:hypothetical protein